MVHLVLECDNAQLQIENANCGYWGAGPGATVSILEAFGLNAKEMEGIVSEHVALDFYVGHDLSVRYEDTFELFGAGIGNPQRYMNKADKIFRDRNIQVDLKERKIFWYNPQRHEYIGFLRLLANLEPLTMEYYIGECSPLENGMFIDGLFEEKTNQQLFPIDLTGVKHVNLVFYSDKATVACLIDKAEEKQVINSIYHALSGEHLLDARLLNPFAEGRHVIKNLFWYWKNHKKELQGKQEIAKRKDK